MIRFNTPTRGRKTPDAVSLRHVDMSLPDLLGRPSLRHAVRAYTIFHFFQHSGTRILININVVY